MSEDPFADRAAQITFTGNSLLEMMVSAAIDREVAIDEPGVSKSVRAARAAIHLVRDKGDDTTLIKILDEIMNIEPTPRKVAPMQQQPSFETEWRRQQDLRLAELKEAEYQRQHHSGSR